MTVKDKIIKELELKPLTGKELSNLLGIKLSSLQGTISELNENGIISNKNNIYDTNTNRNVTLYSLNKLNTVKYKKPKYIHIKAVISKSQFDKLIAAKIGNISEAVRRCIDIANIDEIKPKV
jgi:transcription initiation factor IIE alpha subunit